MSAAVTQDAAETRRRPPPRSVPPDAVTWLTFYLFALLAVPTRFVIGPLGSAGAPSMLIGLLSLCVWFLLVVTRRRPARRLRFYPLRWAAGALVVVCCVSYAIAMARPINLDEMSPADVSVLSLLSWTGTLLLATDFVRSRRRIDDLVWRIAVAGGLLAVLGLAQFVTAMPFTDLIHIPGLTELSGGGLPSRNGLVRPNGTATHPIEYGAILAMILPLALHTALYQTARSAFVRWGCVVALTAVIGISGSRSAYLCAVAGVLVCLLAWTPVLRRWVVSVAVIGVTLVALVWPRMTKIIIGLFNDPADDPSITSRTDSFDFAWAFTAEHPLFGRGFGTFLPKYRIFDNQYLVQLVSVGFIGVAALLAVAVVAMLEMRRVARNADRVTDIRSRDLAASLSGAVLAGFVSMAFFDTFAFPMTMGTLFLVLGIIGAVARRDRDDAL
jgi:hypothetical protein